MNIRSRIDYCLQVYGPALKTNQLERLEKIQYSAARLVTETMKFTSRARLYYELGWKTIRKRIEFLSVCHFHKIHSKNTRSLIRECMPSIANNPHISRRGEQYELPAIIDKHLANTFFSVASYAWNRLPSSMKLVTNMNAFKTNLGTLMKPCKNKLYNFGSKIGNSYQTQLRVGNSQLNGHLFEIGLSNTPACLCGHKLESVSHFLLDCFLYHNERETLMLNINDLVRPQPSKRYLCNAMIYGDYSSELQNNHETNKTIFFPMCKNFSAKQTDSVPSLICSLGSQSKTSYISMYLLPSN